MKLKTGNRYTTVKGEKVTLIGKTKRRGHEVFIFSDEVDRDRFGKAVRRKFINELVANKYDLLDLKKD